MADQILRLPDDSANTGKKLDASELTVGANTVQRERHVISDATTDVALAKVGKIAPVSGTDYGLTVYNVPPVTQNVRPTDGTNAITGTFDVDSGAGTQWVEGVSVRKAASGGSVEYGTTADPVNVADAGGSLTVDGTFWQATQPVSAVALPLPTGATTLAEQQTQTTSLQLLDNAISGAGFNITQQGGVAVSLNTGVRDTGTQRVTIATNDVVPVSQSGTWAVTQATAANLNATVIVAGNATVFSGQQAVTASAVALATNTVKTISVKALIGNPDIVYIGPSGVTISTGMELAPGDAMTLAVTNTNLIYVIAAATGSSVSWIAAN